jgi:hypothetical protein
MFVTLAAGSDVNVQAHRAHVIIILLNNILKIKIASSAQIGWVCAVTTAGGAG